MKKTETFISIFSSSDKHNTYFDWYTQNFCSWVHNWKEQEKTNLYCIVAIIYVWPLMSGLWQFNRRRQEIYQSNLPKKISIKSRNQKKINHLDEYIIQFKQFLSDLKTNPLLYLEGLLMLHHINKKVKTNAERESIFIIKSHQTGPQFQKNYLQWWQTAKIE